MRSLFRLLPVIAILATLTPLSCGDRPERLVARADAEEQQEATKAPPVEIAQELHDVIFSQSKSTKLQWRLEAKSVEQVMDGPISLESVEITYYADDGKSTALTADTGLYDEAARDVTMKGNVTITTSDGGRVETATIHWDQQRQRMSGDGEVTISRDASIITGKGFELFPEQDTFRIFQVGGIIYKGDAEL